MAEPGRTGRSVWRAREECRLAKTQRVVQRLPVSGEPVYNTCDILLFIGERYQYHSVKIRQCGIPLPTKNPKQWIKQDTLHQR